MESSGYDGDYDHHDMILESEWGEVRKLINSEGSSERFASTNFVTQHPYSWCSGINAFQDLCYGVGSDDPPPMDIVSRMLDIDKNNLTTKTSNSWKATPLHLACEGVHSSRFLKTLLALNPPGTRQLVSEKDGRGMTVLDVAWLSHIDAHYRTYADDLNAYCQEDGGVILWITTLDDPGYGPVTEMEGIYRDYANEIWEKTLRILYAVSTGGDMKAPAAWGAVQAIASTDIRCPNIAMWVALNKHPEQAFWKDKNGNFPLHMAASCCNHYKYPIYPPGTERNNLVSIINDWDEEADHEGRTRNIMDQAQSSPVAMLTKIYPEAAMVANNAGRYPIHMAAERGASWTDDMEPLFNVAPGALNKRDPNTLLLPFMLAAVDLEKDASIDPVYKLLRFNPANVEGGIGKTRYEQYLEGKVDELKSNNVTKDDAIAQRDAVIADLRSKLKRKAGAMDPEP